MYSKKEIDKALNLYHKCKSVTKVIQKLEYPSRRVLYNWIKKENLPRKQLILINNPKHPRNPPIEVKMEILHRCFVLGESVKLVSEDVGYTRVSIYAWRRSYIEKGSVSLINNRNITLGPLKEGQRVSD